MVLDVSGHGISAALLTGVVKMSLHRRLAEQNDLAKAVSLVNRDLLDCITDGQFVTACIGIWDPIHHVWTYCAAGHPGGLLMSGGQPSHLPHTGPLLGVMPDGEWSGRNIQLTGNERIYLYTDGAIEAGAPLNTLGKEGLERIVRQCGDLPLADQVAAIMNEVFQHYSDEPEDDVTILAMEFSTAASGLATNH